MFRRIQNLFMSHWGWSFKGEDFDVSRKVLYEGEGVALKCRVLNDGLRLGTAYVRFLITDAYTLNYLVFDSDRDLSLNEKHALRLIDIPRCGNRDVMCNFFIPSGSIGQPFDVKLQVWNPHRLFNGPSPWLFYDSGWKKGFEIVATPTSNDPLTVFISYSWSSASLREWVKQLVEELRKYRIDVVVDWKDLHLGEEATIFMERGISKCKVTLLICDDEYTLKANERRAGVGFETILSSHEYQLRTPDERSRIIAIVRDNTQPSGRKLPRYLGSSNYVDMTGSDWQASPMLALVDAIRRHV
jgi:hypothetical protein